MRIRELLARNKRLLRNVRPTAVLLSTLALVAACGGSDGTKPAETAPVPGGGTLSTTDSTAESTAESITESTTVASVPATAGIRVVLVGTSLTAGLGLDPDSAYPAVLQQLADSNGIRATIVNAGLSGETSAGALRRVEWLLQARTDAVVIETGANDGLRGLDPDSTRANLVAIIGRVRAAYPEARILLAQMEAPPNLGPRYTRAFHDVFLNVARDEGVTLIPFFLEGIAGVAALNQPDGIHPTAEGARRAARNMWKTLAPVLLEVPGATGR